MTRANQTGKIALLMSPFLLVILFLVLNILMTLHEWIPSQKFLLMLRPSWESMAVLLLLFVSSALPRRFSKVTIWVLAPVLTVFIAFSFGEAFIRYVYHRGFVPWTDMGFIPSLLNLLFGELPLGSNVISILAVVLILAALLALSFFLLKGIAFLISRPRGLILTAGVSLALIAVSAGFLGVGQFLLDDLAAQVTPPRDDIDLSARSEIPVSLPKEDESAYVFPRLKDRNVYLFFIESYGQTAFSRPEHTSLLGEFMKEAEDKLASAGFAVLSSFLTSPVFGGWSWLAEATFVTGLNIDSQGKYDRLLKTQIRSFSRLFHDAGYYSLLVAPGTVWSDWPEGRRFFQFDEYLLGWDFQYEGPKFPFVPVPDQFAIYRAHQRILDQREQAETQAPAYVQYVLVSSHAPFSKVPAYIENWEDLGDGSIYYDSPNEVFRNEWTKGLEYPEGYSASIRYVLNVISEYLIHHAEEDSLAILVGDHQPKHPISEIKASFSVPVHVVSRDEELLAIFLKFGYTPGLTPRQPSPHPGMESFFKIFMETIHGEAKQGAPVFFTR
jgi:hypothetical protein